LTKDKHYGNKKNCFRQFKLSIIETILNKKKLHR